MFQYAIICTYFTRSTLVTLHNTVPGVEDNEWFFSLCTLVKNTPPKLPPLFFDHGQISCREVMHARSQCYLADLGSEEQECSMARSPQREVCGGQAKCCNASKRLRGRVYSTFTEYNDKWVVFIWLCSTWIGRTVQILCTPPSCWCCY